MLAKSGDQRRNSQSARRTIFAWVWLIVWMAGCSASPEIIEGWRLGLHLGGGRSAHRTIAAPPSEVRAGFPQHGFPAPPFADSFALISEPNGIFMFDPSDIAVGLKCLFSFTSGTSAQATEAEARCAPTGEPAEGSKHSGREMKEMANEYAPRFLKALALVIEQHKSPADAAASATQWFEDQGIREYQSGVSTYDSAPAGSPPLPAASAPPPHKQALVVVLNLSVPSQAISLDDAVILTDVVRSRLTQFAGDGFKVLSREKVLEILQHSEKTAAQCTGECAVETARTLGADYVIGGTVSKFNGQFAIYLDVKRARDGATVAAQDLEVANTAGLRAGIGKATQELTAMLVEKTAGK